MLASRLVGLLPPLDPAEVLEVSMLASVAGQLADGRLSRRRPFRSPHHAASMAAMVGGGSQARPGEISLAHLGVLFLDELPEFARSVLESLRQPLEAGRITVARAQAHVTYPARFQLVAAMNPCRCGHLDDPALACPRVPRCGADYQARISGPLLDRIDLHVDVPALSVADMALPPPREGSAAVAMRVAAARQLQADRFAAAGQPELRTNGEADGHLLEAVARLRRAFRGAAAPRRPAAPAQRAGLSSRAPGRPHDRRPRWQRGDPQAACRRGDRLSPGAARPRRGFFVAGHSTRAPEHGMAPANGPVACRHMIIGLGSDLIDIRRIERTLARFGDRFVERVFTPLERERSDRRANRAHSYARRYAAKEALSKALGTGFRQGVFWRDIGVVNLPGGKPTLMLTGGAATRLAAITPTGMRAHIDVTLTDEPPLAQAMVIITALPPA